MNVETRLKIERRIAKAAVKGLIEAGYTVSVFDGEETTLTDSTDAKAIEAAMFTTDEDRLHVTRVTDGQKGWVLFIYGNDGYDVIADNTVNIEDALKAASDLGDQLEREYA
ncbi:TPA: hypothetical protein ACI1IR_004362 [Yersinia enterocolitica]